MRKRAGVPNGFSLDVSCKAPRTVAAEIRSCNDWIHRCDEASLRQPRLRAASYQRPSEGCLKEAVVMYDV